MGVIRHRRTTAALIAIGAMLVLVGGVVSYAGHVVSNSEQFARRATSTLGDASMRAVIARRATAQIVAKRSELIAVRPLVESAVDAIVGSPPFQSIFEGAVYDLHRSVFSSGNDTFTLRLADVAVLAQSALRTYAPAVAAKLPAVTADTLTAVAGGDFRQLSDAARTINRVHGAGPWLLAAGVVALMLAVVLAGERGAAVRRAGLALMVIALLVVVLYTVARPLALARFSAGDARTAAGVVWDAFLADLRFWALLTGAAGLLLVACAAVLGGRQEVSILTLLDRTVAGASSTGAGGAAAACALIAVGALAITAPATMISVAAVLAGASLLYAGVRRLLRLALVLDFRRLVGRPQVSLPSAPSRSRAARVAAVAAALAVLTAAVAPLTHGEPALAHPITGCNGYAQLCDRQLSDVVFPATHNSMASATDSGWLFPSQDRGIPDQLAAGVRGLLIDTHYGVRSSRGVATELTAQTRKLATAVDAVGPEFIASVNRLRAAIGINQTGRRAVYLCHAFCEVGATAAVQAFRQIRDFLIARPNQVVILSIEDDVTPHDTESVFRDSGLLDLVYRGPPGPWPTLRQLIEQDRRVVVFAENQTGGIPWYRPQFQLMQETPYHFTSTKRLAESSSCRANRGGSGKALFLLNNWVDTSPAPRPANASVVNAYESLLTRARRCQTTRRHIPNLVAVDFYKRGDLMRVVARLNGV